MARLPTPGQDDGTWGNVLNDFMSVAHKSTGELADGSVISSTIANNAITTAKIDPAVQTAIANSAAQSVTKVDVGLGSVDNTTDAAKPISVATQTALNAKLASSSLDSATAALIGTTSATATAITSKINAVTAGTTNIYVLATSDPDPTTGSPAGLYFRRSS